LVRLGLVIDDCSCNENITKPFVCAVGNTPVMKRKKNDNHISIEIRIYALLEMDQNSQRRNYFQASFLILLLQQADRRPVALKARQPPPPRADSVPPESNKLLLIHKCKNIERICQHHKNATTAAAAKQSRAKASTTTIVFRRPPFAFGRGIERAVFDSSTHPKLI